MSKTSGSTLGVFKLAATGVALSNSKVVTSDGKTQEEEATYFHSMYDDKSTQDRKHDASKMVSTFYDLVTDFYETGWGQAFHFAIRGQHESFSESLRRHEYYLALKLQISPDDYVLDLGCGIGGPMRNISKFCGCNIIGVTINEYQVKRGNDLNEEYKLSNLCKLQQMNFLNLKFNNNLFDKIFSIEATCHAANRIDVFSQAFRVLKKGGLFATYEWVLTEQYNPNDDNHIKYKKQIEKGNALPELISDKKAIDAFQKAGFELIEATDMAKLGDDTDETPWYGSLEASCSFDSFYHSRIGIYATHMICYGMETLRLAPKGTVETHSLLVEAQQGLVNAGKAGIFTPMLLLVGRKPLN